MLLFGVAVVVVYPFFMWDEFKMAYCHHLHHSVRSAAKGNMLLATLVLIADLTWLGWAHKTIANEEADDIPPVEPVTAELADKTKQ